MLRSVPIFALLLGSSDAFTPGIHSARITAKRSTPVVKSTEQLAPSARESGLALALDDGTRKSHSMAENTAFVTGFFKGIETRKSFSQLVQSLHFIYSAQEAAFDRVAGAKSSEAVTALDYPTLRRTASLEEDMEYYYGADWRRAPGVKPSRATKKYVARIDELAADPEKAYLLVAHQYTRYLGDLFGGQMMGGMATRSLGLDAGKGVAFYNFPEISDKKAFIEEWYKTLNTFEFSEEQQKAIVDEANFVFALNIELFEELEGSAFSAVLKMALSTFREKIGLSPV